MIKSFNKKARSCMFAIYFIFKDLKHEFRRKVSGHFYSLKLENLALQKFLNQNLVMSFLN